MGSSSTKSTRSVPPGFASDLWGLVMRLLVGHRKIDVKGGALAGCTGYLDHAPVAFNDPMDHRQSESGALALFLGRKIGIENAFQGLRVHAAAGVGDSQFEVIARRLGDVPDGCRQKKA